MQTTQPQNLGSSHCASLPLAGIHCFSVCIVHTDAGKFNRRDKTKEEKISSPLLPCSHTFPLASIPVHFRMVWVTPALGPTAPPQRPGSLHPKLSQV